MRVQVVDRLGDVAPDWDRLVDRQPVPSPFLRSWWLDHAAGATPAIVLCLDGDELVGGAAFEQDVIGRRGVGLERVRFLGHGILSPDHLDVVARPDRRAEVVDRVVGWLRRPGSRLFDLDGLLETSELPGRLGAEVLLEQVSPVMALPATSEELLARLPGQLRSTVKRATKRLAKDGWTARRVAPEDVPRALADLARLHDTRWQEDSEFLDVWHRFERAATAGARTGDVVLYEQASDDEVVAVELDLLAGDRVCFYQAGRSTASEHRGAGSALKFFAASDAIDRGLAEYDFLRGDEGYEAQWATSERRLLRVVGSHGAAGAAVRHGGVAYIRTVWWLLDKRARYRQARQEAAGGQDARGEG